MSSLESLRRRMKLPFPMRGIERTLYLAVFLVLVMGIFQSFIWEDWEYFGRSGSLVVVIGIILAWRDFVSLVGDIEEFYKGTFNQLKAKMSASKPIGIITGAIHAGKLEELEAAQSNVTMLTEMLRKRLRTTEALILIIGTVVWGYGPVIGKYICKF